jgi:adenine deaminase
MNIQGNLIDVHSRSIYHASVQYDGGIITGIEEIPGTSSKYILPGFVDAHVHIESSMLIPSEFARMAVTHGTVATVSDPHEIANVLGIAGVRFMLTNAAQVPFKFFFGVPSCVPATVFETAGAVIDWQGVKELFETDRLLYLAEMMNYPSVIVNDPTVMKKLEIAKAFGKPIDGHAPGLRGEDALKYFSAGISTDHECFTYEEGLEKAKMGVKILIREGSAARNFEALIPLMEEFPHLIMFCSDDKHPDELAVGHINTLAARALAKGCDLFDVLRSVSVNPVEHYKLPVGLLRRGDPADFILVDDLLSFSVLQTWIGGKLVAEAGKTLIERVHCEPVNNFCAELRSPDDFICNVPEDLYAKPSLSIRTIQALDGQLVTNSFFSRPNMIVGAVLSDIANDVLKFTVVNRYAGAKPSQAFISGFNLKKGALASSVGHDSHNILAVGVDDASICEAINLIVKNSGGISAVDGAGVKHVLPLPVAGIMSIDDGYQVAKDYTLIDEFVKKKLGSTLRAPFMTLSFMALLVIPELKLSDLGLFDGKCFEFVELFSD